MRYSMLRFALAVLMPSQLFGQTWEYSEKVNAMTDAIEPSIVFSTTDDSWKFIFSCANGSPQVTILSRESPNPVGDAIIEVSFQYRIDDLKASEQRLWLAMDLGGGMYMLTSSEPQVAHRLFWDLHGATARLRIRVGSIIDAQFPTTGFRDASERFQQHCPTAKP